jgi:hypothetical protein
MKCRVRDIIAAEDAVTLEDGQNVYDCIHPELAAGRAVELDFAGVSVFASPFFNAALGQLLKDLNADDLNRLLKLTNLLPPGRDAAHRAIDTAARFFAETNYRDAQKHVLEALSQEF